MGVPSSAALFRHFFTPCISHTLVISGCVTFQFRFGAPVGFPRLQLKGNWDEWRGDWCYARARLLQPYLEIPDGRPLSLPSFNAPSPREGDFELVLHRLQLLRSRGLTGPDIVSHFIDLRIAPLQQRSRMMWDYRLYAEDPIRLSPVNLSASEVSGRVHQLCGVEACSLPASVKPIFMEENRGVLRAMLPRLEQ